MMIVAMIPVKVVVPSFLVHQVTSIRQVKPAKPQKNGRWVICQNTGEIVTLRIDHMAALIAMAVMSRLVK